MPDREAIYEQRPYRGRVHLSQGIVKLPGRNLSSPEEVCEAGCHIHLHCLRLWQAGWMVLKEDPGIVCLKCIEAGLISSRSCEQKMMQSSICE